MMLPDFTAEDRRQWSLAATVALAAHASAAVLVLAWARPAEPPVPEPVVLIELPPDAAPAPAAAQPPAQPLAQPQPQVAPLTPTPPVDIPPVRAPVPRDAVTLPPAPPPQPVRQAASAPPQPAAPAAVNPPAVAGAGTGAAPGDPRAKRAELDYFSLISAHLNRRKTYPTEAKKARQEGIVTVRFTVDRSGNVSGVAIKRSSGHELLDLATMQLLQRVAPLPRMPASMPRDSLTLSLPIEYSLRTN